MVVGGYDQVFRALAATLGDNIRMGTPVVEVRCRGGSGGRTVGGRAALRRACLPASWFHPSCTSVAAFLRIRHALTHPPAPRSATSPARPLWWSLRAARSCAATPWSLPPRWGCSRRGPSALCPSCPPGSRRRSTAWALATSTRWGPTAGWVRPARHCAVSRMPPRQTQRGCRVCCSAWDGLGQGLSSILVGAAQGRPPRRAPTIPQPLSCAALTGCAGVPHRLLERRRRLLWRRWRAHRCGP